MRAIRAWSRAALTVAIVVPAVVVLDSAALAAPTTYVVAPTGTDGNDGVTAPFRTVTRCAAVAAPGDTCQLRAGTYRETVRPASGTAGAPITFTSFPGERAVVTGADPVAGWTAAGASDVPPALAGSGFAAGVATGRVFKTTVVTNPELFADQLFLDGKMMPQARWPNVGLNLMTPTKASAAAGTFGDVIVDPQLDHPPGFWVGAQIHLTSGVEWMSHTGTVVANAPGALTYEARSNDLAVNQCGNYCAREGNPYYLTGILGALDAPAEWHYDRTSSTLFFWAPDGSDPSTRSVEVKQRNEAFNLVDRKYVTISNLDLTAANITTDYRSGYHMIDGIRAAYLSHFVTIPIDLLTAPGVGDATAHLHDTGIVLAGFENTLQNSVLTYSAGQAISLQGEGSKVLNNLISQMDYGQTFAGGITMNTTFRHYAPLYGEGCFGCVPSDDPNLPQPPWPADHLVGTNQFHDADSGRATIMGNTVFDTAGSGIFLTKIIDGSGEIHDTRVAYNNVFNTGVHHQDAGPIYATVIYGEGNRIDHNWAHDHLAKVDRHNIKGAYSGTGVYLDGSQNFLVDHNVSWNNAGAGYQLNGPESNDNVLYNNTAGGGQAFSVGSYLADAGMPGTRIENNIFTGPVQTTAGATFANNLNKETDPMFVDPANADHHLRAGSPAIDAGGVIPGVTDGAVGAPDIGAYEHGGADWTPGCTLDGCTVRSLDDADAATFAYGGTWAHCTTTCDPGSFPYNGTWSSSTTAGSMVTATFSGTGVDLHMGKANDTGIVAVSVDGGPETLVDTWLGAAECNTATQSLGCNPDIKVGDQLVHGVQGLAPGTHTLTVRVTGDKHPRSRGTLAKVDRVMVQGYVAPAPTPTTDKRVKRPKPGPTPTPTPSPSSSTDPGPVGHPLWADGRGDVTPAYYDIVAGRAACAPAMMKIAVDIDELDPTAPNRVLSYTIYRTSWTHNGTRYFVDAAFAYSSGVLYKSFADGTYAPDGTPVLQHSLQGRFTTGPDGVAEVDLPLSNVGVPALGAVFVAPVGESLSYPSYSFYTGVPTPNPGGTVMDSSAAGADVRISNGSCSAA